MAQSYDEKPWLRNYDKGVAPEIEIPPISYADMVNETFFDFGDRPAYHFLGVTHTFQELDDLSSRFGNFLEMAGYGIGDVVAVNLPNLPQYLIAHVGALRAGCAVTGMSPLLTPKEMAYQLKDSGAKVLVTLDAIFEHRLMEITDRLPELTHVVATGIADFLPGYKRFFAKLFKKIPTGRVSPITNKTVTTFPELMVKYPPKLPNVKIEPEHTCLIQYTGGTTGSPKGAVLTHGNMVSNIIQATNWLQFKRGEETFAFGFPFFHVAGLVMSMASMAAGCTQILIPNPRDTKHIIKEINTYRPHALGNVPSLYQMLLDDPDFKNSDLSNVRACGSGAAPFPVESMKALEAVVGEGKVFEVYGMTESSPFISINPVENTTRLGSIGLPIQNTRLKIASLDEPDVEVPIGEAGEIIIQGPQVMKGYHNQPEETAHTLRHFQGEPWLHTGDVAKMDEEGFLYIVDRAKDMLNISGYKVFSREVEETLHAFPAISQCAIIGKPDPKRPGSEIVKLITTLSPGSKEKDADAVKEEILGYCRKNMAPYKVPKIIEFVDELPLTAVGKVDKKSLR